MMAIQELVVPRSMPMTLAMWSHSYLRRSGAALSAKHRAGPLFHTVAGYVSGRRPSRNGCGEKMSRKMPRNAAVRRLGPGPDGIAGTKRIQRLGLGLGHPLMTARKST